MKKLKKFWILLSILVVSLISFGVYTFAVENNYEISSVELEVESTGTGGEVTDKAGQEPPLGSGLDYSEKDNYLRTYDTMWIQVGSVLNNFSGSCNVKYTITATISSSDGTAYPENNYPLYWIKTSAEGLSYVDNKSNVITYTESRNDTSCNKKQIQLKLFGANDRDIIKIHVKAEILNSVATNGTKECDLNDDIIVSATTLINTSVLESYSYLPEEYTLNGVEGRIMAVPIGLAAYPSKENKGVKAGVGYPKGDIELKIKLNSVIYPANNQNNKSYPNITYTFLADKPNNGDFEITNSNGTTKNLKVTCNNLPYGYYISNAPKQSLRSSGKYYMKTDDTCTPIENTTVTQSTDGSGVIFDIVLKDWGITPADYIWTINDTPSKTAEGVNKKFSAKVLYIFVPYGAEADLDYDQKTTFSITNVSYKDPKDNTINDEYISYSDSNTDNVLTASTARRPAGQYSISARVQNLESEDYAGDAKASVDVPFIVNFWSGHRLYDINADAFSMMCLFDGSAFDLSTNSKGAEVVLTYDYKDVKSLPSLESLEIKYGVGNIDSDYIGLCVDQPNNLSSDQVSQGLRMIKYDDIDTAGLIWYDTYEEAIEATKNSTDKFICGIKTRAKMPVELNNLANGSADTSLPSTRKFNLYIKVKPKNKSENIGKTFAFKGFIEFYNKQDDGSYKSVRSTPSKAYTKSKYNDDLTNFIAHSPSSTAGGTTVLIMPSVVSVKTGRLYDTGINTANTNYALSDTNELNWGVDTYLQMADALTKTDDIFVSCTIPKPIQYLDDSLVIQYNDSNGNSVEKPYTPEVSTDENGNTVLKVNLKDEINGCPTLDNSPKIRFKTLVPFSIATPTTEEFVATIDTKSDIRKLDTNDKIAKSQVSISKDLKFVVRKIVNKEIIYPNEDFEYTIVSANMTNDTYRNFVAIDNLPDNNDGRETKFNGNYKIVDVSLVDENDKVPSDAKIYFSDSFVKNISKSNIGTVGTWTLLTNNNKDKLETAKSFKITKDSLNPNSSITLKVKIKTKNNKADDIYINDAVCAIDNINDLLEVPKVTTKVIGKEIKGTFVVDSNRNGLLDSEDTVVTNKSVQLLDESGDVVATTTTDNNGNYSFKGLSLGKYKVKFENITGTNIANKGDNSNSNAFHISNQFITDEITLDSNTADTIRNAGVLSIVNIEKTVDSKVSFKGKTRKFTIKVTNPSDYEIQNVSVKDELPSGFTVTTDNIPQGSNLNNGIVTINVGTMKAKEEKSYDITGVISAETGTLINTAKVYIDTEEINTASSSVGLLTVTKSPSKQKVGIGDTLKWSIVVTNTSNMNVTSTIPVSDKLPDSLEYVSMSTNFNGKYNSTTKTASWTVTNIPAGGSVTLTVDTKVLNLDGVFNGEIKNTVLVYGQIPADSTIQFVSPKLTITKNTSTNKSLSEGDEFKYSITLGNIGEANGSGVFKDTIPEGLTIVSCSDTNAKINGQEVTIDNITLAPQETKVVDITVKVNNLPSGVYTKTFKNKATFGDAESNEVSNTVNKGELSFEKTSSVNDLSEVNIGDEITYTIKYKNKGVAEIKDIVITDAIPDGTTLVDDKEGAEKDGTITWSNLTLNANEEKEVSFIVKVNELPSDEYTKDIVNIAKVNNMDTNKLTNYVRKPHLEFSKEVDKIEANVGDNLVYTIKIKNTGFKEMNLFKVTDKIPEGVTFIKDSINQDGEYDEQTNIVTWSIDKLDANEELILKFQVTVDELKGADEITILNKAVINNEETNEVKTKVKKTTTPSEVIVDEETNTPLNTSKQLPKTGILNLSLLPFVILLAITLGVFGFVLIKNNRKNK